LSAEELDLPEDLQETVRAFRNGLPLPRHGDDVSDIDSLLASLPASLQEQLVTSQEAVSPPLSRACWYLMEYGDGEQPVLRRYAEIQPLLEKLMRLEGTDCFAHVFWGTHIPTTSVSSSGVRYLSISAGQCLPIPISTREARHVASPVDASLLGLDTNLSGWLGDYAGHPDYPEGRLEDLDPEEDLGNYPGKKAVIRDNSDEEDIVEWVDDVFEVESDEEDESFDDDVET